MLRRFNKRGQTTAEYAILIALVIGAAMAMQIYVKRGIQGRVRDVVDHTGSGGSIGHVTSDGTGDPTSASSLLNFTGDQYEPYYLQSNASTNQTTNDNEAVAIGGGVNRDSTTSTNVSRNQTVSPGD